MSSSYHRVLSTLRFLAALVAPVAAYASYTPPSAVPYSASDYAIRASLKNSLGFTQLGAYGSPSSCPLKVNLFSQNAEYSLPILSLVGRNSLDLQLALTYNSKVWLLSGTKMFFNGDQGWPAPGWRLGFGRIDGLYAGGDGYNHYYFTDTDGSIHDLRYNSADALYESIDSSYLDFNDSTGILRRPDGTQITFALIGTTGNYVLPTQINDRNGNYITINYTGTGQNISTIIDTVGRTTSFTYNGDGTLATITKTGFGAVNRTWTFGYSNVTLGYSFAPSLTVSAPANGSAVKMLSSVTFPNGTSSSFLYNGFAQLTEVDMLSNSSTLRGKYLIGWQSPPGGGWTTSPTPSQVGDYDGVNTNNWTLAFNTYSTTVTDPLAVPTTTTFLQTGGWDDGLPNQTQVGSPVVQTYASAWGNDGNLINQRKTSVTKTLNDTNQQSQTQITYTTYGNVQEVREYDYGLATLLRKTDTTYVTDTNHIGLHILALPSTVIVYDGTGTAKSYTAYTYDGAAPSSATGAANHDDTNYGTGFIYRGLLTLVTQYTDPVTPSGAITHSKAFDMLGNLRTETSDCCIQKQHNFSSTTQFSRPDSVVRGSGSTLTTSYTYDTSTGLIASTTDENNQVTSYNYDADDRMISKTRPDNTVITMSYDDASANPGSTSTNPITSSSSQKMVVLADGLGRTIRTTTQDASNTVFTKVDKNYDAVGRVSQVSLPYTGSSASYWRQFQYDALGRTVKDIPADGSPTANNTSYSFSGNSITATDNAGKQRKEIMDALNRKIEYDEPDPTNGNTLTLITTYAYDPTGHNTVTVQGAQTRTTVFDGLGRKTSETTPEAGTVNYVYNSYSKLSSRTDARGVITTYSYDPHSNLPSQVSYTTSGTTAQPTASVSYTYGSTPSSYNNGRLITMNDGTGSEGYSYDLLGRKTQVAKVLNNVTYTTAFTLNLGGEIVTETYPSGRVLKRNVDSIGRLQSLQNNSTSSNYISSVTYNSANMPTALTYGNNVGGSFGYSPQRLQLTSASYAEGSNTLFGLSYGYTQNGGDNGQITTISDQVDSGRSVAYSFDALNRLTTALTTGSTNYPQWGLSWTYDRYGNRTAQSVTAGSAYADSVSVSTSTNRVTALGSSSFVYDSNGNITQDDLYKYSYDAENRLVELQLINGTVIATYAYDGNGLRVAKVVGTTRTYSIYDRSNLISEFNDISTTTYTTGTVPQQAVSDTVGLQLYQHPDHLTTRETTDNFGNVASLEGHYPFGETWYDTMTASPSVVRKFSTYAKDSEASSGMLNYAFFREHSARLGRFVTPDPKKPRLNGVQALNRYSYVAGDPVNRIDAKGLQFDFFQGAIGPCDLPMPYVYPGMYSDYYFDEESIEDGPPLTPDSCNPPRELEVLPPAAIPPARPCDIYLSVPGDTDSRCGLNQRVLAKMTIKGNDVHPGGRIKITGVTTETSDSTNLYLDGEPYHSIFERLPVSYFQRIILLGKGILTWTVTYKCDSHVVDTPQTASTEYDCAE